ncbi:YbhB/YbcL family Raf kinase inhibitor-like protein [Thalassolituus sp. LLYu03]|uniref:YbhB/YbcL family Raf kinase inhibitor-like protein n=1 Tax=Thalassolituus sp. LLYu03 TaxID=3421656 RepID=UPI003D2BA922
MKPTFLLLTAALLSQPALADFRLTSTDLQPGKLMNKQQEFQGFGCDGGNRSPQLSWSGAPAGTRSYAITVYDPDAPTGSGWWHWLAFNLPASVTSLTAGASGNSMPAGSVESRTDYGAPGFGGACPPQGDKAHRYQFTVFALNTDTLDLGPDSSGALVGYFLNAHALGKATLETLYQR